jgi:hypothetical protein
MRITKKTLWDKIKESRDYVKSKYTPLQFSTTIQDEYGLTCYYPDKYWISKILTQDTVRKIQPYSSTFICSQTGTGKTTFIFECCLPVALKKHKKILYLCNRSALVTQIKDIAIKDDLNKYEKLERRTVGQIPNYYTKEGINDLTNFGGIEIYTYHRFLSECNDMDFKKYAFVIMDEAHFYISDATFYVFTEKILDLLLEKTYNIPKIYLSATPDESFDSIWKKEKDFTRNKHYGCYPKMDVYVMDEDYSYLNPYFFDDTNWLIEKIKNSSKADNWLIFIRDKKTGKHIKRKLEEKNDKIIFITADTSNDDEIYSELLVSQQMPKPIIISTKVLDVGISINTSNLHMVIFDDNIVEIKQMVGRKRIRDNEKLDIYFFVPYLNELRKRCGNIKRQIEIENKIIKNALYTKYIDDISHPVYLEEGKVKYNHFSEKKLRTDMFNYIRLINELETCETKEDYMKHYSEILLKNFPKTQYRDTMLCIEDNSEDEAAKIRSIVNNCLGNTMNKEQFDSFSEEIGKIEDSRKRTKDRNCMGSNSLNKVLNKYGYEVQSLNSTPTTYKVIQISKGEN